MLDKDRFLAAKIANAIVYKVNETAIASINEMKSGNFKKLKDDYLVQKDSLRSVDAAIQANAGDSYLVASKTAILEELVEKDKLIQQFNTSINDVNALFIIEKQFHHFKRINHWSW